MVRTRTEASLESTPSRYPAETTPQAYHSSDYSFTLQTIMEMQKTLGQLTQAVNTLTEESKKRGDILDKISHKVYAAQVGLVVAGVVLSTLGSAAVYLLSEIWKAMYPLLQLKPHP